jgi:hypothetical protein
MKFIAKEALSNAVISTKSRKKISALPHGIYNLIFIFRHGIVSSIRGTGAAL